MSNNPLIKSPINADLSAHFSDSNITTTYDAHVFPPETNKTVKLGRIKKRNALIKCLGNGNMEITMIEDPMKKIEDLYHLKNKGIITSEQFEQKRIELLKKIC